MKKHGHDRNLPKGIDNLPQDPGGHPSRG